MTNTSGEHLKMQFSKTCIFMIWNTHVKFSGLQLNRNLDTQVRGWIICFTKWLAISWTLRLCRLMISIIFFKGLETRNLLTFILKSKSCFSIKKNLFLVRLKKGMRRSGLIIQLTYFIHSHQISLRILEFTKILQRKKSTSFLPFMNMI